MLVHFWRIFGFALTMVKLNVKFLGIKRGYMKIALISIGVVLSLFLSYVASKDSKFNYSVSGQINAPVEKVFPYLSDIKLGSEWSPYERVDPNMKKQYEGNKLIFDGNREAGSGSVEIVKVVPNELVVLKLIMTKPFYADNDIQYQVVSKDGGTYFTWSMSGDGGFLGKLMTTLIDCEGMVKGKFLEGIDNLKKIVE